MRHPERFLATALLFVSLIPAFGKSPTEPEERLRLRRLQSEYASRKHWSPLDQAYMDTRALLSQNDGCSDFFGQGSVHVLDELTVRLQRQSLRDPGLGLKMSGPFTVFGDSERGISYRLFERAVVNSGGPFYKSLRFAGEPRVPPVGGFAPNTREVRVLMLLHELAHLIRRANGQWLIPDDGNDRGLSHRNTELIESRCGAQIRALPRR